MSKDRRPVYGGTEKFQNDPNWRDYILFYEYFHGDNGAGLGASHQTGWTGVVAKIIQLFGTLDAQQALEGGKKSGFILKTSNIEKQDETSKLPGTIPDKYKSMGHGIVEEPEATGHAG